MYLKCFTNNLANTVLQCYIYGTQKFGLPFRVMATSLFLWKRMAFLIHTMSSIYLLFITGFFRRIYLAMEPPWFANNA